MLLRLEIPVRDAFRLTDAFLASQRPGARAGLGHLKWSEWPRVEVSGVRSAPPHLEATDSAP